MLGKYFYLIFLFVLFVLFFSIFLLLSSLKPLTLDSLSLHSLFLSLLQFSLLGSFPLSPLPSRSPIFSSIREKYFPCLPWDMWSIIFCGRDKNESEGIKYFWYSLYLLFSLPLLFLVHHQLAWILFFWVRGKFCDGFYRVLKIKLDKNANSRENKCIGNRMYFQCF